MSDIHIALTINRWAKSMCRKVVSIHTAVPSKASAAYFEPCTRKQYLSGSLLLALGKLL